MNVEEFAFAYNINSTGMSGIITMTNPPKLVCYCDEENSKTILNALNPPLPPAEGAEAFVKSKGLNPDYVKGIQLFLNPKYTVIDLMTEFAAQQQPTAEGAEEILESIVESLGEPINIHNHIFEIRPYTVEHKTEWWIFHKEVGSGEPLAQWLQNFATLHAQRIADKMVEERLRITANDLKRIKNRKI